MFDRFNGPTRTFSWASVLSIGRDYDELVFLITKDGLDVEAPL